MKLATYVRKLKDRSGNYVVPATRSTGVYLSNNQTLQSWIDKMEDEKFDLLTVYPVGAIFQSTSNTSPASLFGGNWEKIENKFLLGTGTRPVGNIGGEENHILTEAELALHTHRGLLVDASPVVWFHPGFSTASHQGDSGIMTVCNNGGSNVINTYASGSNVPHNNMPPYYAVNIWRRTA